jgi:hypothetical protein
VKTSNNPGVFALPGELRPGAAEFDGDRVRPAGLRRLAAAVVDRPELWADQVRFDLTERYFVRLHHEDRFELWLICWELGQDTLLHDHGGSVGAFAVARGALVEDHAEAGARRLRTRSHRAGDSVAFGARYLHNLVNVETEPAITVHAYSRPLSTMNFYCWLPSGAHHLREIPCDSPEPDTADLELVAARTRAPGR